MLLRLVGLKRMRVGHREYRAVLATVLGWNRGRAADLLYPTPPHNLDMPTVLETEKNIHTHTHIFSYTHLEDYELDQNFDDTE